MVPATQIHLADCKSDNTLTRGLGRNKLQLCMLVFADLRATYWSADVMYRLFQRAQTLLAEQDARPTSHEVPIHSATPGGELHQVPNQLLAENEQAAPPPLIPVPPAGAMSVNPMGQQLWSGASPQFSDVDQLLSPGFSLSQEMFLDFFPNYPAGNYGNLAVPPVPTYYSQQ